MLRYDKQIDQHKNLNPETSRDLERLSRRLANNPTGTRLSFTTGVGLSDVGMPCRLNAVIIPTLRVLQRLRALGFEDISYRVYQATDFIIAENWLDQAAAEQVAKLMDINMRSMIRQKYPDIAQYIHLDFGTPVDTDTVDSVVVQLQDSESPSMRQILAYAKSKSHSALSAYRYAAANIICNGHTSPQSAENHRYTLLVWWAKEKPFFQLGRDYEKEQWYDTNIIPLIQSTWAIPPYYPQIWKEIYLSPDDRIVYPTESPPHAIQWDLDLTESRIFF